MPCRRLSNYALIKFRKGEASVKYRHLDLSEIGALELRGCTSEHWRKVQVTDPFYTHRFTNVHFGGEVYLGAFEESVNLPGHVECPAGIHNSSIHNCTIGDNVYI